jgi:rhomboid protease GluP
MLQRGQALMEQGDWALAASTFARVVGNGDPDLHVAALLGLAEARYRMDDEVGALQCWLTATQAPETALAWRAWKALAAARVRSGDLTGAARAYREAERRAPAPERAEIAARLGWLAKESGDRRAAQRYFRRSRSDGIPGPVVTWAILAITIGIGVSSLFLGEEELWVNLLALDKAAVADGEYWRLLTVVLVHGSLIHLAFNMYALWAVGPVVEALYGPWRYLFLYLACAAGGSTASYVFGGAGVSVGASGAIFGLFGALLVADRIHKPALTRSARSLTMQIGALILINLLIGFSPGLRIDNAAHIGGLVTGCWLGWVMVPRGATLRSFWSGGLQGSRMLDGSRILRLAGAAVPLVVMVLGVLAGPTRLG